MGRTGTALRGPAGWVACGVLTVVVAALMLAGAGFGGAPPTPPMAALPASADLPTPAPSPSAPPPAASPSALPAPAVRVARTSARSAPSPAASTPTPAPTTHGLLFDSNRLGNYEIYTANTDGSNPVQLTRSPGWDSIWPKMSPDHTTILFYRTPAGIRDLDYSQATLWMMNADGSNPHQVLGLNPYGWGYQSHAEWSPDGRHLVMVGGPVSNYQIYITAADGTGPVRVTSDGHGGPRPGVNLDPSWSPDGLGLLFVGCPQANCTTGDQEVYSIGANGSGITRLTTDSAADFDPYYSPDGKQIAWLRNAGILLLAQTGIMVMNANGSNQHWLINDGNINSKPDWSVDGTTIFFHRMVGIVPFNVYRIPATGGAPVRVLADNSATFFVNEYPDAY